MGETVIQMICIMHVEGGFLCSLVRVGVPKVFYPCVLVFPVFPRLNFVEIVVCSRLSRAKILRRSET